MSTESIGEIQYLLLLPGLFTFVSLSSEIPVFVFGVLCNNHAINPFVNQHSFDPKHTFSIIPLPILVKQWIFGSLKISRSVIRSVFI